MCNKISLKNAAGVDTSDFVENIDLASVKSGFDKLDNDKLQKVLNDLISLKIRLDKVDIGKLETTPVDLGKLNDAAKYDDWI